MIKNIYAIRDLKNGFLSPVVEENDQIAMRNFAYSVNQGDSLLNFAAQDYSLFLIGKFDTSNGKLEPYWPVELICEATSLKE